MPHARQSGRSLALLFLDLDNFKRVNDTLRHHIGDDLLREVARRLNSVLREHDVAARPGPDPAPQTLARLGGDEFLILLQDLAHPRDAEKVAERILAERLALLAHELYLAVSIGIAVYPGDGDGADALIRNADIAMDHAKRRGKASYAYHSEAMREAALLRLDMETRLRRALSENRLQLHYEPQIELSTGGIAGFEALLRWNDPQLGEIPPATSIPLAEETGLIVPITA